MSLTLEGWPLGQEPPEATDSAGLEDFPEARPTGWCLTASAVAVG